jgi:hypothetical protein
MALGFMVEGPTTVQTTNLGTFSTFADLGYTDNNDLVSVDVEYLQETIESSDTGRVPVDVINMGVIATVNMTLVKWDDTKLQNLLEFPSGGAGQVGTIGLRMFGNGSSDYRFKLKLVGDDKTFTFHRCHFEARAVRMFDFGNRARRVGLSITCLPEWSGTAAVPAPASTDLIWTEAAS